MQKVTPAYIKHLKALILYALVALMLINPLGAYAVTQDELRQIRRGQPFYNPAFESSCETPSVGELPDNTEVQEQIFRVLLGYGLTAEQVSGIMGNMKEESGFEPQRQQGTAPGVITPADQWSTAGGGGWGLVQWTPGSKMINPVKAANKDPNSLLVQLEFLWDQLEGRGPIPETRAGDAVKASTTIEDAVRAFASYERFKNYTDSSNPQYTLRIASARQIYDKFKHLAPAIVSGGGPAGCQANGTTVEGVTCPATLEEHAERKGYFKMPEAPNGEYVIPASTTPDSQRYGSRQLVCVLYTVALAFNTAMQGKSKLRIGDLNASGHASHYRGIAVDLSGFGEWQVASHTAAWKGIYNRDATIALGKMFIDTGTVRNIWWCEPPGDGSTAVLNNYAGDAGGIEGSIKCINGHSDHFHVDIKLEYALPGSWKP